MYVHIYHGSILDPSVLHGSQCVIHGSQCVTEFSSIALREAVTRLVAYNRPSFVIFHVKPSQAQLSIQNAILCFHCATVHSSI